MENKNKIKKTLLISINTNADFFYLHFYLSSPLSLESKLIRNDASFGLISCLDNI